MKQRFAVKHCAVFSVSIMLAISACTLRAEKNRDDFNRKVRLGFPTEPLPAFEFQECQGETLELEDLKGRPWVASFIFCRCTHTCPQITRAMKDLHDRVIKDDDQTVFVTFTVDPKYDTADVLLSYSEIFSPDRNRWKFVTGTQQEIHELVVNGFGEYVEEQLGKARRPGFEVAHTERVVLVNAAGIPVGTFLGTNPAAMNRLNRILTGRDDFPEPGPNKTEYEAEQKAKTTAEDSQQDSTTNEETTSDNQQNSDQPTTTQEASTTLASESTTPELLKIESSKNDDRNATQFNAEIDAAMPAWTRWLPTINALLNSLATLMLLCGYVAIRKQKKIVHRNFMISAFVVSALFLASYLTYHYQLGQYTDAHGRKFTGSGLWRSVYFAVLIPHVILAIFVPILAIRVFQHAFAERWEQHKQLAKITFPIWLYVSVTGVIIYLMLYHWPS